MGIDRRSLLAIGGLGAFGGGAGMAGPETALGIPLGLTIRVIKNWADGWCVVVPDPDQGWVIGSHTPPIKLMPIKDFLDQIDKLNIEEAKRTWA